MRLGELKNRQHGAIICIHDLQLTAAYYSQRCAVGRESQRADPMVGRFEFVPYLAARQLDQQHVAVGKGPGRRDRVVADAVVGEADPGTVR